jgi:GTP pyrophosphokinase
MGEAIWERFSGGKQGTLWYYHTLIELFKISGTSPIVEELERVIAELEKHVAQNEVLR